MLTIPPVYFYKSPRIQLCFFPTNVNVASLSRD